MTSSNRPTLPLGEGVDTAAFAKLFDNTAASYKFLWTLALLNTLRSKKFNALEPMPLRAIIIEMLALATPPVRRFKLFFGIHDKIAEHLAQIENVEMLSADQKETVFTEICNDLAFYVPARWLTPFFVDELRGAGGPTRNQRKINRKIHQLAAERFAGENPPPYRFAPAENEEGLLLHPTWLRYLADNADIIDGWARWHWAKFLQSRNQNMPAVINKIAFPERRPDLEKQRTFWRAILHKTGGVICIYSGEPVTPDHFALDHYLPWSFVGHNNLWNLVPAPVVVNSGKSDNLPHPQYLGAFIDRQHKALVVHKQYFAKKWRTLLESYVADLRLDFADLTNKGKLNNAYRVLIPPLITLAKANRFSPDWIYEPASKE